MKKPLSWTITPVDPKGGAIGAGLRVAREERGLSVDDVAAVLKIRREHIASIESSRVDDLPGLPYAIGFIRTYAEYLGMDGLDAVRRFKEEISEPEDDGALTFPTPISDRKFPTALLVAGAVVLAAALYGAWYFYSGDDAATVDAPATPATEAVSEPETAAAKPVAPEAPAAAAPAPVEQSAAKSEAVPERPAGMEADPASPAEPADDVAAPAARPAATRATDSSTVEAATESAAAEAEEEQPSSPGGAETEAPATESEAPARPSATPPPPAIEEAEAAPAPPAI
ncbi:MAG: helix-turn-helix domain-containing protein, partial [Alphaproteobacteria bacterium]